jgi:hypothetical protein
VHPNEWLSPLWGQQMPSLWTGQQIRDGTLGEAQHAFAKLPLAYGIFGQEFLHLANNFLCVQLCVALNL